MKKHENLYLFYRKQPQETKPVEVLLANIPDFKNPQQFQGFISELNQWMDTNHTKIICNNIVFKL